MGFARGCTILKESRMAIVGKEPISVSVYSKTVCDLTDEEIKEVYSKVLQTHFVGSLWVDFARAILARARSKGCL